MPSTRPVCAEPSSSSSACHETSSSSRAFSRTCVYLDWATTGSSRKLYMELMSKAPFAVLTDGKHYHQPRSSVLGCSSWGRIRRRRAISINAARTLLPLWQLTNDGCLEVVENTPAECTRLRNDILNSNDGEPTPTDSKTFYDSLEELGSNSSHKIVTLKKRSSFMCRKFTGRPALSLSFSSRHYIATPRAHNHSSAIASRNHDQYIHHDYPCCSKTYRPRSHNMPRSNHSPIHP